MNTFSHVPPGFRFHPTDEELVDYYLRKKIVSKRVDLDVIKDVDLYKIEPWDLQELCKIGSDDQNEWYFFSHKDKKYPTGTRTNRATKAGFWKATGRDKGIYVRNMLVGMRKTLVFYKGRAPNGQKSDWIMHEYRLETNENGSPQEEGWVVCRVFKKRLATVRKMGDMESPCWHEQVSFMPPELESPRRSFHQPSYHHHHLPSVPYHHHQQQQQHYSQCKQEVDLQYAMPPHQHYDSFLQLPQLESPKVKVGQSAGPYGSIMQQSSTLTQDEEQLQNVFNNSSSSTSSLVYNHHHHQQVEQSDDHQVMDWRVLDKFVASQLSSHDTDLQQQQNAAAGAPMFHVAAVHIDDDNNNGGVQQQDHYASTSTSSCQIDPWK